MISRRLTLVLSLVLMVVVVLSMSGADAARRCVGVRLSLSGEEITYVGPVCIWWPANHAAPTSLDVGGDDSSLTPPA